MSINETGQKNGFTEILNTKLRKPFDDLSPTTNTNDALVFNRHRTVLYR